MAVMKVMFSLAEPLKGPQRGCSGMCLAKGVKGRVYSRALSPDVEVKIALEILLIFQQYKVEQQVLYKSWRAPDPCVKVNNYIVQALQLDSFPYWVMEKSVAEGREILQASDSFSFFFPCYLLMSEAQHCFASSVRTLEFIQLSSWLPPTLKFPEPAEHCSLQNKTFHVTWWPTGFAQLKVPQHIHLQQKQSISNVTAASSLRNC